MKSYHLELSQYQHLTGDKGHQDQVTTYSGPLHTASLTQDVDRSQGPRSTRMCPGCVPKSLDAGISTFVSSFIEIQGQMLDVCFQHRNFVIRMKFSYTGTIVVSFKDAQLSILLHLQAFHQIIWNESPRWSSVDHLWSNVSFIKHQFQSERQTKLQQKSQ